MLRPKDFKAAYHLFIQCRWFERPMLLLVFAGQLISLTGWIFSKIEWVDRGLLIFLAGFVLLMANFFIQKPGDPAKLHYRMISAVFLTIIFATVLGAATGLISLIVGLLQGFDPKLLSISARIVGVFGIMAFVSTLIKEWKFMAKEEPQ